MRSPLGESFVIWLDDDLEDGELRGTIEIIARGRRIRFEDERSLGRILRTSGGGKSLVGQSTTRPWERS